ncbi:MAG: HlyC/CorC family transporter [Chloroflexi bacterium]|nr:HlyC/CorC family transporter [Chloroflexota bacterium]
MELGLDLLLIVLLIALNAFFVIIEFSVVVSRRPKVEALLQQGYSGAKIVLEWLSSPEARERLIAAAQLGVTLVSLALGAVGDRTFEELVHRFFAAFLASPPPWLEAILPVLPLVISLTTVSTLHVVFGEQVPKVAALRNPEIAAVRLAPAMQLFMWTFRWFIDGLDWTTRFVLRLLGWGEAAHPRGLSPQELRFLLQESEEEGVLPQEEGTILKAALDFWQIRVRQVMVPRTEIVAAPADTPLREVLRLAAEHGLTKIPLYEGDLDKIVGIVHIKKLLRLLVSGERLDRPAREVADEPLFVPESLPIGELLKKFRENRQHIAIVIDEYGGVAGLVTLEDILEELIGEVGDPYDTEVPDVVPVEEGVWNVDGQALIDDVNEALGLHLSSPYYDTVAGYVLDRLGRIPDEGDSVDVATDGVRLTVTKMDKRRIAQLRIERTNKPARNNPAS